MLKFLDPEWSQKHILDKLGLVLVLHIYDDKEHNYPQHTPFKISIDLKSRYTLKENK